MNNLVENKHKHDVQAFFSARSKFWKIVYDDAYGDINIFHRHFVSKRKAVALALLDKYAPRRAQRILDAGCGPGNLHADLLERAHDVMAVDICNDMLKEVRRKAKAYAPRKIQCSREDLEALSFDDGTFDGAICLGVLQYLYNDGKGLEELYRVVKPGGFVIVSLPNILRVNTFVDPYYYLRGLKFLWYKIYKQKKVNDHSLYPEDIGTNSSFRDKRYFYIHQLKVFKRIGFTHLETISIGFGPVTFFKRNALGDKASIAVSDMLDGYAHNKGMGWMTLFANRWVIILRKPQ